MYLSLFWALVGCAVQPASVRIDGDPVVTLNLLADVPLPIATVLDAEALPIEPQPAITWTVTPPEVAWIAPGTGVVTPLAEGTALVVASVGTVESSFTLNVRLPDAIELTGLAPEQTIEAGRRLPVDARVLDGESVMETMSVLWASSDPAIAPVENGEFVARQAGEVTITASAGAQAASVNLTVVEAPAADAPAVQIDG